MMLSAMNAFGGSTRPNRPLNVRQVLLLVYLVLAFLDGTHASSLQSLHNDAQSSPETLSNQAFLLEDSGSLRRVVRQSLPSGTPSRTHQTSNCTKGLFQCYNGECLPKSFLCDGTPDCKDGSDEKDCSGCRKEEDFRCGDGTCIAKEGRCDKKIDCAHGCDERDCCKPEEFQCKDMVCIPKSQQCNGKAECSDMSDEYLCNPNAAADTLVSGASSVFISHTFIASMLQIFLVFFMVLSNTE